MNRRTIFIFITVVIKMQRVKIVYNCVGAVSVANADNEPVKTDKTKIIEVA